MVSFGGARCEEQINSVNDRFVNKDFDESFFAELTNNDNDSGHG